jgi:hypothetical protein
MSFRRILVIMAKQQEQSVFLKEVPGFCASNQFVEFNVDFIADTLPELDPALLKFKTNEYPSMCKDIMVFNQVLNPINLFIRHLSKEDQSILVKAIVLMHHHILTMVETYEAFQLTLQKCGEILISLDAEIDLCKKLFEYTKKFIPVDDMSESGSRPQDSNEMTFFQEEVYALTSIALLCKIFFPIIGELALRGKKLTIVNFKEVDCASIFTPILARNWETLMRKLNFYVTSLVDKRLTEDSISSYHGLTTESVSPKMQANVLIKKFITENIYNGNVTKFITACARSGTNSQYENAKTRRDVQYRMDPTENAQEDGNTSKLESESKPSKHSADFTIILKHQTQHIWMDYVNKYGLDTKIIAEAKAYYDVNVLAPTPISIYLLTNYFGEAFGGGKSMKYIRLDTHTTLVVILQLIIFKMNSVPLMHALSMVPSDKVKTKIPDEHRRLTYTWTAIADFRTCRQRFPVGFGEKTWDGKLKEIVDELVTTNYLFNTAPVYWDLIQQTNMNGTIVHEYNDIIRDICRLLYHIYTED